MDRGAPLVTMSRARRSLRVEPSKQASDHVWISILNSDAQRQDGSRCVELQQAKKNRNDFPLNLAYKQPIKLHRI
jgi:hypothetical protein